VVFKSLPGVAALEISGELGGGVPVEAAIYVMGYTIPSVLRDKGILSIGDAILYEDRGLGKELIKERCSGCIIVITRFIMVRRIDVTAVDVLVIELDLPGLGEAKAHLRGSGIVVEKSLSAWEFGCAWLGPMSIDVDRLDLKATGKIEVEANISLLVLPVFTVMVSIRVKVRPVTCFQEMSSSREGNLKPYPWGDDGDEVVLFVVGGEKDVTIVCLGRLHEGVDPNGSQVEVSNRISRIGC
jgi:hypothetical protein